MKPKTTSLARENALLRQELQAILLEAGIYAHRLGCPNKHKPEVKHTKHCAGCEAEARLERAK